jgi:hypothetical protein
MAGLLDGGYSPDPLAMGLLGMGGALLTPRQLGGGIGPAMQAFSQQAMQAQMLKRQMAQDDIQRQMLGLRMSEAQEGAEDRKRRRAQEDALQQAARGAYTPAMPGVGDENNPYLPVKDTPAQFDRKRYIDNLYGAGFPGQAMKVEKSLQQDSPYAKIDPSKFTPDSLQAFAATGGRDPSVLRPFVEPPKPPAPTEIEKLIQARNLLPPGSPDRKVLDERIAALNYRQPPASMTVSYGAPFSGVGPDGKEMLFQPSNRGGPPIPTGLAAPPKVGAKPTEDENKSAGYAVRMEDALRTLTAITSKNPGAATPPVVQSMVRSVSETAANAMTPVDRQRVEAAQLDALDAALTLATGAAYTKEQLAGLSKSYFPQIGDKPATIAEKQARLQKVIETARIRAGTAAPNIDRVLGGARAAPSAPARPTPGGPGAVLKFDAQGNLVE